MKPGGQVDSVDTTDDGDVIVGFKSRTAAEQASPTFIGSKPQTYDAGFRHWQREQAFLLLDRFRSPGIKLSNLWRAQQSHPLLPKPL